MFSNFIPDRIKTFRDSDNLWMNDEFKNKVQLKHKFCKRYLINQKNNEDFVKARRSRIGIDNLISKSKKEYYQNINKKLNNPSRSSKTYWSIMKTFSMVRRFLL